LYDNVKEKEEVGLMAPPTVFCELERGPVIPRKQSVKVCRNDQSWKKI